MTGTIWELAVAMAAFIGSHVVLASYGIRTRIIGAIGANGFRGLYSLIALALLVWAAIAFHRAPYIELFVPNIGMKHLSLTVMVLACILLVGGYSRRNPTMFMTPEGERTHVTGIIAITRHPLMWAIGLWAIVHMTANGDAAAWIFFGGLGLLAFGGAAAQDRKKRLEMGDANWQVLTAQTSYFPFAAMIAGRSKVPVSQLGWGRIAGGIVLYFILLFGHKWVIGVSPLPF